MYIKFETIYHCPLSEVPCCCCSAVQLCPVLCDPVVCSTPALLVLPISRSLPRLMSTALVMPSSHLILWCPVLLLLSIFPSIKDFSNELAVCIRWPKYWSFSFSPSNEYSGLISLKVRSPCCPRDSQKSSPAPQFSSILWHSAFLQPHLHNYTWPLGRP